MTIPSRHSSLGSEEDDDFHGEFDVNTLGDFGALTPLALTLDIKDREDSLFADGEEEDGETVYSRESTKYPKITRTTLDLFGGKEYEKEQR